MKIVGLLISIFVIYIGIKFILKPKEMIKSIQRLKYKTTADPRVVETRVSRIIGIILTIIGIYYLTIVIFTLIYPV